MITNFINKIVYIQYARSIPYVYCLYCINVQCTIDKSIFLASGVLSVSMFYQVSSVKRRRLRRNSEMSRRKRSIGSVWKVPEDGGPSVGRMGVSVRWW